MLYSQVIDNALEDSVGKAGLSRASLERELNRAGAALDKIRRWIVTRQYLSARRQA